MSFDRPSSEDNIDRPSSDEKAYIQEFETAPREHIKVVNHVSGAKKVTEANNGSFLTPNARHPESEAPLLAAFAAAKIKGALNPWSRESLLLYGCAAAAFCCAISSGYDGKYRDVRFAVRYWCSLLKAASWRERWYFEIVLSDRWDFTVFIDGDPQS